MRSGIDAALADDSNDELRSTVATPAEIRTPRSAVPAGICERKPAACSAADGPASTVPIAALATPVVAGTARSVTNSLPALVNHAWRLARAVGLGVGDAGDAGADGGLAGGCVGLAGLLARGEPWLGDVLPPTGASPSDPAGAAPHPTVSSPAVSNPALASTMGGSFMVGLLDLNTMSPEC
jgi:hypothetical protein